MTHPGARMMKIEEKQSFYEGGDPSPSRVTAVTAGTTTFAMSARGTSESPEQKDGKTGTAGVGTSSGASVARCVELARGSIAVPERSPMRVALSTESEAPAKGEENVGYSNK